VHAADAGTMARPSGIPLVRSKTCSRCGRSGSHAFRRTGDGVFECSAAMACRAWSRRNAGLRQDGRGRLPRFRTGWDEGGLGIAYVIGPEGKMRDSVGRTLRTVTEMAVVVAPADRPTLAALASRNVRLIAVDATCLTGVGFRNELSLRRRQPRLGSVPILVYGGRGGVELPDSHRLFADGVRRVVDRLRTEISRFEGRELQVG
jgi:hypothetical protein